MEYKVIRRSRKTLSLKIDNKGEIYIICPLKFPLKEIEKIVENKREWIQKQILNINSKHDLNADFINYKKILFLGAEYLIPENTNILTINQFNIKKNKSTNNEKCLRKWLIQQANEIIFNRLDIISKKLNIDYREATIISARKKWGSCDSLKRLRLNFRLIMLNLECIDYVIIHELCHIKFMNHSKNFWQLVGYFIPNYKEIKNVIKSNSFVLDLF